MKTRQVVQLIPAQETSDGAGVRIMRSIGGQASSRLDPFLLLDEFGSDNADDYLAGFPSHPHRGFETVTYMLNGHMRHEDHLGNCGHLGAGDVQWMTAGRGIVHSEMPEQEAGRMRGFQLWLNLPSKEKLCEPSYRDIPAEAIPVAQFDGGRVKIIAGVYESASGDMHGAITGRGTRPLYFDVMLEASTSFSHPLDEHANALIYVYEGVVGFDDESGSCEVEVRQGTAAILGDGTALCIRALRSPARFLLLAAQPLGEPIVQHGPFVMNTHEEIEQAVRDYHTGELVSPARAELIPGD